MKGFVDAYLGGATVLWTREGSGFKRVVVQIEGVCF